MWRCSTLFVHWSGRARLRFNLLEFDWNFLLEEKFYRRLSRKWGRLAMIRLIPSGVRMRMKANRFHRWWFASNNWHRSTRSNCSKYWHNSFRRIFNDKFPTYKLKYFRSIKRVEFICKDKQNKTNAFIVFKRSSLVEVWLLDDLWNHRTCYNQREYNEIGKQWLMKRRFFDEYRREKRKLKEQMTL